MSFYSSISDTYSIHGDAKTVRVDTICCFVIHLFVSDCFYLYGRQGVVYCYFVGYTMTLVDYIYEKILPDFLDYLSPI